MNLDNERPTAGLLHKYCNVTVQNRLYEPRVYLVLGFEKPLRRVAHGSVISYSRMLGTDTLATFKGGLKTTHLFTKSCDIRNMHTIILLTALQSTLPPVKHRLSVSFFLLVIIISDLHSGRASSISKFYDGSEIGCQIFSVARRGQST